MQDPNYFATQVLTNYSDAFGQEDVVQAEIGPDGVSVYKNPVDIRYEAMGTRFDRPQTQLFPKGGVPLGIGIANDIFGSNLQPTPVEFQPNPYIGVEASDVVQTTATRTEL